MTKNEKKLLSESVRTERRIREKMVEKSKGFFEITPEMVAFLDIYLGNDLLRYAKEAQRIFKLDNNQGYMLIVTWANDRFRKYGNPTVNNLLPVTKMP